ncbi:MAG: formate/nitrite transporter family protein [Alphaproteobacteria bacterium]|nr:formate/nitrite transporter family protein [Alphaproteobacteria bacterium]MDP6567371.1 formate/nitrite transporter family protein [Alphaproteobacteria bacterium]MDP6814666.1 formate/nitrite transporter family protein [Alphaproteobacteria bacterium]
MVEDNAAPRNQLDAYAPAEIALLVETVGVRKARQPLLPTLALGTLAGAFIALGAAFFTLVMTEHGLGYGPSRLLGGVAFSLGLVLVVVAGAELFTGNNLIVMAWAERKITGAQVLRNWLLVYLANFAGAVFIALLVHGSGIMQGGGGAMAATATAIAEGKLGLSVSEAFFRGVLCNALVCLAVWLCFAAHTVTGKILAIIFPISAFVALGFEHSVANMYLIPVAMLQGLPGATVPALIANLVPVTLGNIVGGSVFVALAYWAIYLRPNHEADEE